MTRLPLLTPSALAAVAALTVPLLACEKKDPPPAPASAPASAAPPASASAPASPSSSAHVRPQKVEFPEVPIRDGVTTTVHVAWKTPAGTAVNEDAPFRVRWNRSDALEAAPPDVKATGTAALKGFDIAVKPLPGAPNATLGGVIDIVVCDSQNHSVCLPVKRLLDIEFVVGKSAPAETTVTIPLPEAHAG